MVSFVVHVIRIMRDYLLSLDWDRWSWSADSIDCEPLTSCLSGTDSTVIHILILNVNDVFRSLIFVVLVGAIVFPGSISILRLDLDLLIGSNRSNISRRPDWTNHRLSDIVNNIGRTV